MNLPAILDVIIGLVFIYLILSLLASEIQELLSALVQWRSKHLKKTIESLLAGGSESAEAELAKVRKMANALYNDPLINTLNQEARGMMANGFRKITKFWGLISLKIYCFLTREKEQNIRIFGYRNSGPSYIHAETFATTLLETLKIPQLSQKASGVNLAKFKQERIDVIKSLLEPILNDTNISEVSRKRLSQEFDELEKRFNEIVEDLKHNKVTLSVSVNRMAEALDYYNEIIEVLLPDSELLYQINSLKRSSFNGVNQTVLLRSLQRSVIEILEDYPEIKKAIKESSSLSAKKIQEIYGDIAGFLNPEIVDNLPNSLIESLSVLAQRTQVKIDDIEHELEHFQKEVQTWFDRSMERATGVYKRNAKGVAIMIGVLVAVGTNADTIHIVSRLSKDTALRTTITERAIQSQSGDDLSKVRQTLEEVSLPIGWSDNNLRQQADASRKWHIQGWHFPYLTRILGWVLSGVAIAMGAPFWFDMLGKVVNVRNAGPKPTSSTEDNPALR